MKLFGSLTSPFVRHCRIELGVGNFQYEFFDTDYSASAKGSPTQKVPYFIDKDLRLTDSTSILMYLMQAQGKPFLHKVDEMERYQLAGTTLDTAINLFLLEKEGQVPSNNAYLRRQSNRVASALSALNDLDFNQVAPYDAATIRIACLLDWGLYRQRFSLEDFARLRSLLETMKRWNPFIDTAPPA